MSQDRKPQTNSDPLVKKGIPGLEKSRIKVTNLIDNVERTFLPVDSRIGKYRVIEEIDRGGMAVVYKAIQTDLDRCVALKVLPANITINRRFVERFLSEAHAVAKLNHPNIVSIHEVSMENNIYFLAMDYIPGKNLFFYLNYKKPKLVEVLEITIQLADALSYAHGKKIIHRDLKLNNVIMRENKTPVLIDFGLAKALGDEEESITKTGEIMGSPAYMAPERILGGSSDERGDICSLGIMLYEMLTFKNPYLDPRSIHQTTINVIEADPILPRKLVPWLPYEVEAITLKAMSKAPEDRYQTMTELQDDLRRYQRGEQVRANPPSIRSKTRYLLKRHRAVVSLVAIVALFSVLFVSMLYMQNRKEQWHWQLIVDETFNDSTALGAWTPYPTTSDSAQALWQVQKKVLTVASDSFSYAVFNRLFPRDIKFEFDIRSQGPIFTNAGFFAFGPSPDNAFCFNLHHEGTALCGVTYPHSSQLFYEYDPQTFPIDSIYHVVVEKIDQMISFTVNGVCIARMYDYFPRLSRQSQQVGFFAHTGTYIFDNVRIYRRAVPMLASPTIIADRFMAYGDIESAIEEYRELLLDFPSAQFRREVELKIADCLLRVGGLEEAQDLLDRGEAAKSTTETDRVNTQALKGILFTKLGREKEAESCFFALATLFPGHHINRSILSNYLRECERMLLAGQTDSAAARIILLTQKYPRMATQCGRMHVRVMEAYLNQNQFEKAQATGATIIKQHSQNPEIVCMTRLMLSRVYLGTGEKSRALDLLNLCVNTHRFTMSAWEAWLTFAEIYEYEGNYADALAAYKKVYEECPLNLPYVWQARIRMGELSVAAGFEETPAKIFLQAARARQPFIRQQIIARFYAGSLPADSFQIRWKQLYPHDNSYLTCIARQAMLNNQCSQAQTALLERLAALTPRTWEYMQANTLLCVVKKELCTED
jgi:serine/threonine protein kinase/tetratricopeptide (TPR) repeat protein